MDFYSYLAKTGRSDMLYREELVIPEFSCDERLMEAYDDILDNNRKTLVYGDYDPDGAWSREIQTTMFDHLGFTNYKKFDYVNRTHDIDNSAVSKAIREGFEYMIICDAGSSAPGVVKRLSAMGIKVILIDHHQSPYGYDDFGKDCYMINTTIENRIREDELILSAGALSYLVACKVIAHRGFKENLGIAAMALVSLYADSIDMSSALNRGIYYKAMSLEYGELPKLIQRFMGEYSRFNRRFIEFTLTPRLNSLFRAEEFKLLNEYLNWKEGDRPVFDIVDDIDGLYTMYREEVKKASDIIEYKVMRNFIIGNLTSAKGYVKIPEEYLHNYTGLVANNLMNKYNKTAIVYADAGSEIKASLRDSYGRGYLSLFQTFCKAGGHNSAFGIHIPYVSFDGFIKYLEMVDTNYSIQTIENEPVLISSNYGAPDETLVNDMAIYNEFAGSRAPIALFRCVWKDIRQPKSWDYYMLYRWGDLKVKSKNPIRLGSEVYIKPGFSYNTDLWVTDIK